MVLTVLTVTMVNTTIIMTDVVVVVAGARQRQWQ
jgi:hypothetical protein